MKKIVFIASLLCCFSLSHSAFAQEDVDKKVKEKDEKRKEIEGKLKEMDEKKQSQEIIIRKKGDKNAKISVEINGDKITINGKPLADFKDDNITINKRKITVWDRNGTKALELDRGGFLNNFNGFDGMNGWSVGGDEKPYAFLGVTTDESEEGAKITQVTKESAAEKADLKKGDIITRINDKKVGGSDVLSDVVRSFKPKEEVTIYYNRDGKENSSKVTLGEKKESNSMSYSFSGPEYTPKAFTMPNMKALPKIAWGGDGAYNFNYNNDMLFPRHQKLGLKIQDTEDGTGVKVLDIDKDSPAEKAGLKKDDIVTEVGGKKVNNTDEARDQLQENQEKATYNLKAKRKGTEMSFDIKIPKKLKTANL